MKTVVQSFPKTVLYVTVFVHNDIRKANVEARKMFAEATITVTVAGRPRITA